MLFFICLTVKYCGVYIFLYMASMQPIVSIRELIRLRDTAAFPINDIVFSFRNSEFVKNFIASCGGCFDKKEVAYIGMPAREDMIKGSYIPLHLIYNLMKKCGQDMHSLERAAVGMCLGAPDPAGSNVEMRIVHILYNSTTPLTSDAILNVLEATFNLKITSALFNKALGALLSKKYIHRKNVGDIDFYTLRGEEAKFQD